MQPRLALHVQQPCLSLRGNYRSTLHQTCCVSGLKFSWNSHFGTFTILLRVGVGIALPLWSQSQGAAESQASHSLLLAGVGGTGWDSPPTAPHFLVPSSGMSSLPSAPFWLSEPFTSICCSSGTQGRGECRRVLSASCAPWHFLGIDLRYPLG